MDKVIGALRTYARTAPLNVALIDERTSLTYADLLAVVNKLVLRLEHRRGRIGLLADNSVDWATVDLAALASDTTIVPLAGFFSDMQIEHVVRTANIRYLVTDQRERLCTMFGEAMQSVTPVCGELVELRLDVSPNETLLPPGTQKITFTSGTTADPKGVCLGQRELETTADALRVASAATSDDRHLCVLPLATLLENVGGIYAGILAGATVCVPRLSEVGLSGSSGLDVDKLLHAMRRWQASSVILVPQMLEAIVRRLSGGEPTVESLRHVAVGGAPVAPHVLQQAHALGLPVYEGYGLSECASVVALNRHGASRIGSVGKPLPHLRVQISDSGEIIVRGLKSRGYLGDFSERRQGDSIATGDIGHLDADGFLYITGRRKNMFVTSFGRNVAPEWVERELATRYPIMQAAVFGEARPFNSAVLVPHPAATEQEIAAAVAESNRQLPDYARVSAWITTQQPFSPRNGMATFNGRLRRDAILRAHAGELDALYQFQQAG